jgi:hypothetical protein
MYTRQLSSAPLNDQRGMLVRLRIQDFGQDIDRIRLAKLARAARPRDSAPLPALLRWLRSRLPMTSASQPAGIPASPARRTGLGRRCAAVRDGLVQEGGRRR